MRTRIYNIYQGRKEIACWRVCETNAAHRGSLFRDNGIVMGFVEENRNSKENGNGSCSLCLTRFDMLHRPRICQCFAYSPNQPTCPHFKTKLHQS